jgi:hypothetical protein
MATLAFTIDLSKLSRIKLPQDVVKDTVVFCQFTFFDLQGKLFFKVSTQQNNVVLDAKTNTVSIDLGDFIDTNIANLLTEHEDYLCKHVTLNIVCLGCFSMKIIFIEDFARIYAQTRFKVIRLQLYANMFQNSKPYFRAVYE